MWHRRWFCIILACVVVVGCVSFPVEAATDDSTIPEYIALNSVVPYATTSFRMTISAQNALSASSSFPLAAGETVTIKASYSPFFASIDVGLVAPDGNFYYVTVTNGIIDKTIQVNAKGDYTLRFRNNSDVDADISGYVNY